MTEIKDRILSLAQRVGGLRSERGAGKPVRWPPAVREEAIAVLATKHLSIRELSRALGLSSHTLSGWWYKKALKPRRTPAPAKGFRELRLPVAAGAVLQPGLVLETKRGGRVHGLSCHDLRHLLAEDLV